VGTSVQREERKKKKLIYPKIQTLKKERTLSPAQKFLDGYAKRKLPKAKNDDNRLEGKAEN